MESYRSQLLTGATDDHNNYDDDNNEGRICDDDNNEDQRDGDRGQREGASNNEDHICDDYDDQIDHQERDANDDHINQDIKSVGNSI